MAKRTLDASYSSGAAIPAPHCLAVVSLALLGRQRIGRSPRSLFHRSLTGTESRPTPLAARSGSTTCAFLQGALAPGQVRRERLTRRSRVSSHL